MKKYLLLFVFASFFVSCTCVQKKADLNFGNRVVVNNSDNAAGGFLSLASTWAKQQTEVFVSAAEKGLRFEFRCYGKPEDTVFSGKKADDDMTLFGSEHIELQLAPNWQKDGSYYHFAVNPAKSYYHAIKHDTSWTPKKFDCTVENHREYRSIVLDIPWETVGEKGMPKEGTVWKANFCRASKMKNSGVEFSSWTGAASFHDLNQMGELVFSEKLQQLSPRILKFNLENGNMLTVSAALQNEGKYILQSCFNGQVYGEKTLKNKDIADLKVRLENRYIPLKSLDKISLRLLRDGCVVWEKSAFTSAVARDFMSLDKIEYVKNSSMRCKLASASGQLVIKNDEKVFAAHKITAKNQSVSLQNLPSGRYIVEFSNGTSRSSRVIFICEKMVEEAAPMKKKAVLAAKGENLFFDNKPFYLLGISGGTKTHFPMPAAFTLRYGRGGRKFAPVYQGLPGKRLVRKPYTGYAFNYGWEKQLAKHFALQSKSSQNIWRTLCYEANLKTFFTQKDGTLKPIADGHKVYGEIYKMAKKAMPDKIFSIHVDNMAVLADYAAHCDVMEFASWRSSYHASDMLLHQGDDLDIVRRHVGNKPVVMWLGGSIPNGYCRSAEEIRAGVYHTIIKGGAGNIIHMGHSGVPGHRTRFWSMLSMLSRELDGFYSELINGSKYEIELPPPFAARAAVTAQNELLIVILNKSAGEQVLTLNIPDRQRRTLIFTPYEPRVVRLPLSK